MSNSDKYYTVKWPADSNHQTKSLSGVLVETNVQKQIALHFYNEYRELEDKVEYAVDGSRTGEPRNITYVRMLTDTMLISDNAARQLRDMLNTLFPDRPGDDVY